jgi:molecular chaperone IbpA
MSRNDFSRLFDQLESFAVGFGPTFRDFQTQATTGYPPHNIVKNTENIFILELAVAGFKKHQITAETKEGILTIRGDKDVDAEDHADAYQYRGIASRSFSKSFRIAEFFEIVDARLEDGILSVTFMKNTPEEAKPKLIAIK